MTALPNLDLGKRAADEDLLARSALYEDLLRKHKIDFSHYANTWVSSGMKTKFKESEDSSSVSAVSTTSLPDAKTDPLKRNMAYVEE